MKKFLLVVAVLTLTVILLAIPVSAVARTNVDSSQNSGFPTETNVDGSTDTSIFDSMMPGTVNTNVPDSAVDSNSAPSGTSPVSDMTDGNNGTSVVIGVIVAIVAVIAVIVLVLVLMPKSNGKK